MPPYGAFRKIGAEDVQRQGRAILASCVKAAVSAGDFAGRSGLQAAG